MGTGTPPGQQRPEESQEIVVSRRQHDDNRLAGLKAQPQEAGGDPLCPLLEGAVGNDLAIASVAVEVDMGSLGMGRRMPVQNCD